MILILILFKCYECTIINIIEFLLYGVKNQYFVIVVWSLSDKKKHSKDKIVQNYCEKIVKISKYIVRESKIYNLKFLLNCSDFREIYYYESF